MSVPVELHELAERIAEHDFAYLVTVTTEGRAHVVAVSPSVVGDGVVLDGTGRRSLANVVARPDVTLLWPPRVAGGYSLIVDGRGAVAEDEAAGTVRVAPSRAVLHRPAPGSTTSAREGACGADCVEVPLAAGPGS